MNLGGFEVIGINRRKTSRDPFWITGPKFIKGLNVEYLVSRNICLFNDLFKQKVAQQNKRESTDPIQNPNPTLICFI